MKESINYNIENQNPEFSVRMAGLNDLRYAPEISAWTEKAGTMLPKTPEEITALFLQGRSAIVLDQSGNIVSHAAAPFIYKDGSVELGALCTGEKYRGRGAATLATEFLLGELRKQFPDKTLFALANPISAKLFEKIGGKKIECAALSDEVWENCETCPKNPGKASETIIFECCDTPYNLTDVGSH